MTDTEIQLEILKAIKKLDESIRSENRKVMTTQEACEFLGIAEGRTLTHFFNTGVLTQRYGAQHSGYKWSKAEIMMLQNKLLIGEVQLPKRKI